MRLLLLLLIAGVAAYFTNPERAAHESAARAALEAHPVVAPSGAGPTVDSIVDDVVGYARGMLAGEGRYENFYLGSKYSIDAPGALFVECYGAFTIVRCSVVEPGAPS